MRRAGQILAMSAIAMSFAASAGARDRDGYAGQDNNQTAPMPLLSWPGKTQTVQPTPQAQHNAASATAAPTSLYAAPPPRWRPVDNKAPAQPGEQPPATSPQPRLPPGVGLPPHFYSVARQYGVQPDPVQLSSQFLASTPQSDMAEPPPLPPPHTVGPQSANMSTAAATNQVRQAQEAAADADSAALGN